MTRRGSELGRLASRSRWLGVCAGLLLSACVHRPDAVIYVNSVNALARPDASAKKTYVLLPAEKDINPSDLQFLEYAGFVEKCLKQKGMAPVGSIQEADLLVFLGYGIGSRA